MDFNELKKLDSELIDLYQEYIKGTALGDVEKSLKNKWNKIKCNEEILSLALKTEMNIGTSSNINAPGIAGLTILDYKNVDPLAFDTIRHIIFNYDFSSINNPIFKDLNITFLMSLLLNKDLTFSSREKKLVEYYLKGLTGKEKELPLYIIYNHPEFRQEFIDNHNLNNIYITELLSNYEKRAQIRRLTKSPF